MIQELDPELDPELDSELDPELDLEPKPEPVEGWCDVCRWGDAVRHGQGLDVVAPQTGMSRLTLRLDGTNRPDTTIR